MKLTVRNRTCVKPPREITLVMTEKEAGLLKLLMNNQVTTVVWGDQGMREVREFQEVVYDALDGDAAVRSPF